MPNEWEQFSQFVYLPCANQVCEGNVFTGVCLSTGGVSVQERGLCSREGLCPGESLSRGEPLSRDGGLCLCRGGLCPGWGLCPEGGLYQGDPPYGNERAVGILLECILVWKVNL